MAKRIILADLKDITGKAFRDTVLNDAGNIVMEQRFDSQGKAIMAVPRNGDGVAIPGVAPEPVYVPETTPMGKGTLGNLLKVLYLRKPQLTRQDTINGTTLFQNLAASEGNDILELEESVYKWVKELLSNVHMEKVKGDDGLITEVEHGVGLDLFGTNLGVIEDALDNVEKLHQPKGKE